MPQRIPRVDQAMLETTLDRMVRKSVEEALIDMYPAGVSTRQVDDISQLLWGDRMPSQTLSDKLKKVYADIDAWRERPLGQEYPYAFMDGVWHKGAGAARWRTRASWWPSASARTGDAR